MTDLVWPDKEPLDERPNVTLTEDVMTQIHAYVRAGVPLKFAAEAAGVNYHMALRWSSWGKRGYRTGGYNISPTMLDRYRRFAIGLEQARAESVAQRVMRIEAAAQAGVWQADAWWLERQYPEEFGRVNKLVVQSTDSLESELRELLGPEAAEELMDQAREKIEALREARDAEIHGLPMGETEELPAEE